MDPNKKNLRSYADYYNCRMMPHGGIILFPVTVVTLGWVAAIANDGCDFARLTGPAVEMLTGSSAVPFLDCGMTAYRVPGFYPAANAWRVVYSDQCQPYENFNILSDRPWVSAEWLNFSAIVIGGASMMFLWITTCLTLRRSYWRAVGVGVIVACICQASSLVWFFTELCHTSSTGYDDFSNVDQSDAQSDGTLSSCSLFFGSKCAILSSCLWFVASIYIIFGKYPVPIPKLIAQDDSESLILAPPTQVQIGGPRRGFVPMAGRGSRVMGNLQNISRNRDLASSTRSCVTGASTIVTSEGSAARSVRRPGSEFSGSQFSAGSFV